MPLENEESKVILMPENEIASRGGAKRWRTIKRGNTVIRVAVVKKKGKRGGQTIAGPPHKIKGKTNG
jgi:hypothetical protein